MQVVVRIHPDARPSVDAWVARLRQAATGGADVAAFHLRELVRRFEETDGMPPDASFAGTEAGLPAYFWRYTADTIVLFRVEDVRVSVWRGLERRVVVTGVVERPKG